MEPNRGASKIALRDGCDWSRALRLDLAFGGELAKVPPATQRFDQLHAARHLLYTERDHRDWTTWPFCRLKRKPYSAVLCSGFEISSP
jgi:hypothetical protein